MVHCSVMVVLIVGSSLFRWKRKGPGLIRARDYTTLAVSQMKAEGIVGVEGMKAKLPYQSSLHLGSLFAVASLIHAGFSAMAQSFVGVETPMANLPSLTLPHCIGLMWRQTKSRPAAGLQTAPQFVGARRGCTPIRPLESVSFLSA